MFLESIKLLNFRNYQKLDLHFDKDLTILLGLNAAGKTNLLEAIEILSVAKSFRVKREQNLVLWGLDFCRLESEIKKGKDNLKLEVIIDLSKGRPQKTVKIGGVKKKTLDLIGKLSTVLFYPEDLNMISASPSVRRQFLDVVLCKTDNKYCYALAEYRKILRNRNLLLNQIREGRATTNELGFWDKQLTELGTDIILKRGELIKFLNTKISPIYVNISGVKTNNLKLIYKPNLALLKSMVEKALKKIFFEELMAKRDFEIRRGVTLIGPHRDDFSFELQNRVVQPFASRGEFRSIILALKSSELDYLESNLGERPILLLDDIFSELDKNRRHHLRKIVDNQQTIITTTDLEHISSELRDKAEILKTSEGSISKYPHEKDI